MVALFTYDTVQAGICYIAKKKNPAVYSQDRGLFSGRYDQMFERSVHDLAISATRAVYLLLHRTFLFAGDLFGSAMDHQKSHKKEGCNCQ